MQKRADELMKLSAFELQKRALAIVLAMLESETSEYCENELAEAVKALPFVQRELNTATQYYNDTYEEIFDEAMKDVYKEVKFEKKIESELQKCKKGVCVGVRYGYEIDGPYYDKENVTGNCEDG